MTKKGHCNCKTGCHNRRCSCLKNSESCDEQCGCVNCENPLNGMDVEKLSVCAIQNIAIVKALSDKELAMTFELPCGHEVGGACSVIKRLLLSGMRPDLLVLFLLGRCGAG